MLLRVAYHEALDATHAEIIRLGELLAAALKAAVRGLEQPDPTAAARVIADADAIEELRRNVEAACTDLLWRQQPVAGEFRRIAAMSEIAEDYERIGHYIVEVAKHAIRVGAAPHLPVRSEVARLAEESRRMLDQAAAAYRNRDDALADDLVARDDASVDELYHAGLLALQQAMESDSELVASGMSMMFVLAALQRISEHAISIAWHTKEMLGTRFP